MRGFGPSHVILLLLDVRSIDREGKVTPLVVVLKTRVAVFEPDNRAVDSIGKRSDAFEVKTYEVLLQKS